MLEPRVDLDPRVTLEILITVLEKLLEKARISRASTTLNFSKLSHL